MAQISIIVPCYNQEKYIAECLDSILSQTFKDFEVIIVNDGSIDGSEEIITQYVSKYENFKLINQSNQGVIAARNNAIAQAVGKYIFPLDGDDKIAPTCLEKMYEAIVDKKGDVIYSGGVFLGERTGEIVHLKPTKFNMAVGNRVFCSALYRKSDWEKYGGYDPIMFKGLEDWEFWLNFVEDDKLFYKIEEALFFYRISKSSRNSNISKSKQKELEKLVRSKHAKLYDPICKMRIIILKISRFLYQKKCTKEGKISIKILGIPVLKIVTRGIRKNFLLFNKLPIYTIIKKEYVA